MMSGSKKARDVRDVLLVNLSACKYSLVREAADRLGYELVEDESELWDLFWSDLSVSSDRVQRLLPFQRLNHFPGMLEICRKAALSRHMTRMAARLPADYRFYPTSLVLPDQLDELMAALRRNKARADAGAAGGSPAAGGGRSGGGGGSDAAAAGVATFILKPSAGTQGRGIALVQFPHQLAEAGDVGSCVAQAYVSSPLLLDGFKFDLRVYALVASVDPLRIHLYDEGLARLATEPYKPPSPANLRATTMHLTNYAVNKAAAGFVSADSAPAGGGSKRPMSLVLAQLAAQYGTTKAALQGSIADVVIKTLMAIQPLLAHTYHTSLSTTASTTCPPPCSCPSLDHMSSSSTSGGGDPTAPCGCPPSLCFELLGFDIMFDTQLQPWLLEVNHSPSFASDSKLDRAVKGEMVARVMHMLGQRPEARRTHLEAEARAQSERLYSSPAGAVNSGTAASGGANGSSYTSVGAVMRRAQSALPRSRQLQAAAAALEEISANSAALLAAGGHVWGGGVSDAGGGGGFATTSRNGYNRPASSGAVGAASPRGRQYGGGGGQYGGGGTGGAKRSLSFSSGAAGGGGGSSSGLGISSGGFKLVFPVSCDDQRKRYYRILQAAADLYPQQRCQCPWCSRRREISLLAMSGQQLGLAARPPSAVILTGTAAAAGGGGGYSTYSHGLTGHLPARPGALSAQRRRSGLAATSHRGGGAAAAAAAAGEDGGSDTEGLTFTAPTAAGWEGGGREFHHHHHRHHNHHHHLSAPGSFSTSTGSPGGTGALSRSPQDAPRGKPPRPSGSELRASSRSRSGPERQPSGGGAPAPASPGSPSSSSGGRSNGSQPPTANQHHIPPFPAPPTMASVLAGIGSYNGYGHGYGTARTVLQQRRTSPAPPGGGGGGSVRHLSSEDSMESAGPQPVGCELGSGGCLSANSSGQLGRSAAGGGGGLGLGLGLGYGMTASAAGQLEPYEDPSSGSHYYNHCLPDMYGHSDDPRVSGLLSPRSQTTDAQQQQQQHLHLQLQLSSSAPADTSAQQQPHPHSRSNQMLGALRPLSNCKSHPQTRLGSAPPHQHVHEHLSPGAASGRWSARPGHSAVGGGGGGGGGSLRSSSNSEAMSAGGGGGRRRDDDPWVRSHTTQRQKPQQRGGGGGAQDDATYGRKPRVPPPRGGGGGSGGGGRVAAPYRPTAARRGGGSDSPDTSGDDGSGGGLRRSVSCGELGVEALKRPSQQAPAVAVAAGKGAGLSGTGHRSGPTVGGAAAAAAAAAATRPRLASSGSAGGGAGGGGGESPFTLAPPHFFGHGQGALAPTSGRGVYGSNTSGSGGGSGTDPGQDASTATAVSSGGSSAAAAHPVDAGGGGKGQSSSSGGGGGGGTAGPRGPRFSGPRRKGSAAGSPMSAADLELLLVRAKTTSVLNNRYVTVYMHAGGGPGGGPRSPR